MFSKKPFVGLLTIVLRLQQLLKSSFGTELVLGTLTCIMIRSLPSMTIRSWWSRNNRKKDIVGDRGALTVYRFSS